MRLGIALATALSAALAAPAFAQPGGGATPAPAPAPSRMGNVDATPERLEWIREAESMMKRYEQAADQQQRRMISLLVREYQRRLGQLNQRYADRLTGVEKEKRQRQLEAIALLEKFIEDHPDHKLHTPDAMYRLAALYLDQSESIADNADEIIDANYGKSLDLWEKIIKDFPEYRQRGAAMYLFATYVGTREVTDEIEERRAIQVYRAMVCANKFQPFGTPPAMLEREVVQKRLEGKTLVNPYQNCTPVPNTDPELILYGWVRGVAASHFATPGEMDEAIASYEYGLVKKDHRLYDEALYMLAWSYYRRDILDKALELFDKSVVRYDQVIDSGGKPSLKLREEAMQYIAVTITDPWDGEIDTDPDKAWARAVQFYNGRENEPHVREVWVTLGKAFYDLGGPALDRSVDAYEKAIGKPWHLHPDNPETHLAIVQTYERKGDKEAANKTRAELATRYSPCPPERKATRTPEDECGRWYEANETNRKAMANYRRIGERMLEVAVYETHLAAIDKHNEWTGAADGTAEKAELKRERDALFNQALGHYRSFLKTYPASKNAYAYTYGVAEVLFYLGRYLDRPGPDGTVTEQNEGAVRHYRWVVDHKNLSAEFYEDSLLKILKSYEITSDEMIAGGQGGLKKLEIPGLTPGQVPAQEPIPEVHLELQKAYDEYARLVDRKDLAPKNGFNAGLVSLAYFHLDDAVGRFEMVLRRFCGNPNALRSKEALLAIHTARKDDAAFRKTNRLFISKKCGDADAIKKAQTQNRKLVLREATRLANINDLAAAGQAYYQYFHDAPVEDDERAAALYNAAQFYEAAGQPKRALYLYKEFSKRAESRDPDNKLFRDSPYRLPALILFADSYGNSYDYQNAARKYLEIYRLASDPKKYGVAAPGGKDAPTFDEVKRQALFNAAAFYELDRDFAKAITYYKRYERLEVDRRKKDRALWAVARIHKSSGKVYDLEKAYRDWRRAYGNDKGNELDKVASYYDLAKMYSKRAGRANAKKADEMRAATIKTWEGIKWNGVDGLQRVQAAKMAGEFDLFYAEQHFQRRWLPAKITKRPRKLADGRKAIANLETKALEAIKKFDTIANKYKSFTLQFAVAAKVRVGQIYLDYNAKIFNMPTPKEVLDKDKKTPGFIAFYEEALTKELNKKGYRDIAKQEFLEVVEVSKKPNVVVPKKWVTIAKDELNKEFDDVPDFPILNDELAEGTDAP